MAKANARIENGIIYYEISDYLSDFAKTGCELTHIKMYITTRDFVELGATSAENNYGNGQLICEQYFADDLENDYIEGYYELESDQPQYDTFHICFAGYMMTGGCLNLYLRDDGYYDEYSSFAVYLPHLLNVSVNFKFEKGIQKVYYYGNVIELEDLDNKGYEYNQIANYSGTYLEAILESGYEFDCWKGSRTSFSDCLASPDFTLSSERIYVEYWGNPGDAVYLIPTVKNSDPAMSYTAYPDYLNKTIRIEYYTENVTSNDTMRVYFRNLVPPIGDAWGTALADVSQGYIDIPAIYYGPYEIYFAIEKNGIEYTFDTITVSMLFEWEKPKVKGEKYEVTANEFNEFRKAINQASLLNGSGEFEYDEVEPEDMFTAELWNDAWTVLYKVATGTLPIRGYASPGSPVKAEMFDTVKNKLNPLLQ